MELFLFVIDDRPGYRRTLAEAQACLEDHLRDRNDVSDVWWDDEQPLEARLYFYGGSHCDYAADEAAGVDCSVSWETTDQLIWPVNVPDEVIQRTPVASVAFGEVELSMEVRTGQGKDQYLRVVSPDEWAVERLRPLIVQNFAVDARRAITDRWDERKRT